MCMVSGRSRLHALLLSRDRRVIFYSRRVFRRQSMNNIDGFRGSLDNETSARLRYVSVAHGVT